MIGMLVSVLQSEAQQPEKPPRPITVIVENEQQLNFGTIIPTGTMGSVTVDFDGIRSNEGSVIVLGSGFSAALFRVEALPGTLINIQPIPSIDLTGSHGGTLHLTLGAPSTGNPFITRSQYTDVYIGGTLTVKSIIGDNPSGSYSGIFQVTFIQQ
jgi:hypothetical protein